MFQYIMICIYTLYPLSVAYTKRLSMGHHLVGFCGIPVPVSNLLPDPIPLPLLRESPRVTMGLDTKMI